MITALTKLTRFFRSVKLTVVLLVLIALTCMVGMVISQAPLAPAYTGGAPVIARLFLWFFRWHDIYRSPLLVTLLTLLAANVFTCSFKTLRRPTARNFGWILTHVSLVVILVGIVIGQITGKTGLIQLHEAESSSAVTREDGTRFDLGFTVALDDFVVEHYEEHTESLIVLRGDKERALPVTVGRGYRLPDGSGSLEVVERIAHATVRLGVVEDENSELNPAIRVVVAQDERKASAWVFTAEEVPTQLFDNALSVQYTWCDTEESYGRALLDASSARPQRLLVQVSCTDTVSTLPIEIGKPFPIEGTDYTVEILRYVPDFRLDTTTGEPISASEEPNNPAIQVRASHGESTAERWAFARFPEFSHTHPGGAQVGLDLTYVVPAQEVVRIVEMDGQRTLLVRAVPDAPAEVEIVELGQSVQLGGSGWTLTLAECIARPRPVHEVIPSLDARGEPAIEVKIRDELAGVENNTRLMANLPGEIGETRILYSRELSPKQYTSEIRFIENGREKKRGAIRVNAPLRYGGFTFYQSSYGNDGREFTVLQVRKDLGTPIVFLGFILLCMGLLYGVYIEPTMRKRKGAKDTI